MYTDDHLRELIKDLETDYYGRYEFDDLQKMIDDPNTPESSKAQLRTSLQQAKNGKEGFQDIPLTN